LEFPRRFLLPQSPSRSFFSGGGDLSAFEFGFLLGRSGSMTTHLLRVDLADDISY